MIDNRVKENLELIDDIMHKYDETIFFTIESNKVENFKKWIFEKVDKLHFLEKYIEVISIIDGFDFNGLIFYSLNVEMENNIYEVNNIYWENENLNKYLFLGESSISWYCFSINKQEYCILDKPSGSIIEEYNNSDEFLLNALKSVLVG